MNDRVIPLAEHVARRFALLPGVEAVALAGSQATGAAGDTSDIDLYVYSHEDLSVEIRAAIGREFSDKVETVDWWGPSTQWEDRQTGIHVDAIFFDVAWIEGQLERILTRYEACLGYTTCFWHTVRVSRTLFDRAGWFNRLQQRAMQDYPMPLVKNIVALNYPVLRQLVASSYLRQLEHASARGDLVSLNHRTAALLASYFDILFAVNRLPHPGEKRLLDFADRYCTKRPENMRRDVIRLLEASTASEHCIGETANHLLDGLDAVLRQEGMQNHCRASCNQKRERQR